MNFEGVRQAIATRLSTWTGLPASSIAWENKLFTPPTTGVWCRVTLQYAPSVIACLADVPHTRDLGAVVIQIFDRLDAGTANINNAADSIRSWLEYFKTGDLELLQGSKLTAGADGNGFYQINVRIEFRSG